MPGALTYILAPSRSVSMVALLAGLGALGACADRPSETECVQFADKMVQLLSITETRPAAVARRAGGLRAKMLRSCVDGGSRVKIACTLKQARIEDVEANCS